MTESAWTRIGVVAFLMALSACGAGAPTPFAPEPDPTPTPDPDPVPPPHDGPVFVNVAAQVGIAYQVVDTTNTDERGMMAGGAAVGDYDRDGNIDLLVTRVDDSPILYRNKGDGTFEDVSAAAGLTVPLPELGGNGVCFGDIENAMDRVP